MGFAIVGASFSANAAPLFTGIDGAVKSDVVAVGGPKHVYKGGPKHGPGYGPGPGRRGGHWRGHGRRGPGGAAIGLGIAGAIIGGAIIANEAERGYYAPPPPPPGAW